MTFSLETTLGDLLNNAQAKAVLDKHFPGLTSNPMIGMVKGMSLEKLVAMPQAAQMGLSKEKVISILDEINKLI